MNMNCDYGVYLLNVNEADFEKFEFLNYKRLTDDKLKELLELFTTKVIRTKDSLELEEVLYDLYIKQGEKGYLVINHQNNCILPAKGVLETYCKSKKLKKKKSKKQSLKIKSLNEIDSSFDGHYYVNMSLKLLKNGGRKAPRISKEELEQIFIKYSLKTGEEYNFKHPGWLIEIINENQKLNKDISKIIFSFSDNLKCFRDSTWSTPIVDDYLGYITLNNGFTFLGCYGSGDWEEPIYFIVYYDGKNLRGYIPTYGNTFNSYAKTAFGSDYETEVEYPHRNFIIQEQKSGNSWLLPGEWVPNETTNSYEFHYVDLNKDFLDQLDEIEEDLNDYPWNMHKVEINFDAVIKDIESRIEIIE